MASVHGVIPVVDFSTHSVEKETVPTDGDASVSELAGKIHEAFTTIGFVYLTGHGISEEEISGIRSVGDQFFTLPTEVKQKYQRIKGDNFGWVSPEQESLNPERPGDLKEAFNVVYFKGDTKQSKWPVEVPELKNKTFSFCDKCTLLTYRILKLMGIGLKLKDPDILVKNHQFLGSAKNESALRLLYYPALPQKAQIKPGQVRCGEHSDYGSITLLFQDHIGGLQVKPVNREYVPAEPVAGAVLVNIGDLMQRWTADMLISTKHRVLIPEEELRCQTVRRSLAFFVQPDSDALIECLDGSGKYPPITSERYLEQKFAATYL